MQEMHCKNKTGLTKQGFCIILIGLPISHSEQKPRAYELRMKKIKDTARSETTETRIPDPFSEKNREKD